MDFIPKVSQKSFKQDNEEFTKNSDQQRLAPEIVLENDEVQSEYGGNFG